MFRLKCVHHFSELFKLLFSESTSKIRFSLFKDEYTSLHFRSLYSMLTQAWGGPFAVKHQTSSASARKRKKVNKTKKLTGPDFKVKIAGM